MSPARFALPPFPPGRARERADLGQQRGADAASSRLGYDDDVRLGVLRNVGIHEPARDRHAAEARDRVDEAYVRRQHVTEVLDPRRWAIRIRHRPYGDHRLEVSVRLGRSNREPCGHGCRHVESSFGGGSYGRSRLSRIDTTSRHAVRRAVGERRHSTRGGVKVKLFAGLRELAGWSERDLDNVARVDEIWSVLGLGPEPQGLLYAVNKEYATRNQELRDGDEVALIPPVSGGDFRLSEEPLSLDSVVAEVAWEEAGAIATFVGTTRVQSRNRTVKHLEYEAYPGMAEKVMAEIADELRARYRSEE